MKISAYAINAFAKTPIGGNPAGVVLEADALSDQKMKEIAGLIGFSETAFVMHSEKADFKVRFFTPTEEVDLCGHATVGTFAVLLSLGVLQSGHYTQETKAGILGVEVQPDGTILMKQALPSFNELVNLEALAESLGLSKDDLNEALPAQIVSTGLRDIMVPIKNVETLNRLEPDFDKVTVLSKAYDAVGYHLFALTDEDHVNAYCRNLAPLYGIPEESATGTSNGALACYLLQHQQVSETQAQHLVFRQGYSMGKPSEIQVSLSVENQQVQAVTVGGVALNLEVLEIEI